MWVKWDPRNKIPFKANDAVKLIHGDSVDTKQVGNGEHKLANQIGGVVDPSQKDFDVLGHYGERIEVKEFGNFRSAICSGKAELFRKRINKITDELHTAFNEVDITNLIKVDPSFVRVKERIDEIAQKIPKGIGKASTIGRSFKKKEPVMGLKQIFKKLNRVKFNVCTIEALIGDHDIVTMTELEYLKIMKILGIEPMINVTCVDRILSMVHDPLALNPEGFDDLWESIKASEILFSKADYVVIVDDSLGFYVFDQEEIDEHVVFRGTSKGDINFTVKNSLKKI